MKKIFAGAVMLSGIGGSWGALPYQPPVHMTLVANVETGGLNRPLFSAKIDLTGALAAVELEPRRKGFNLAGVGGRFGEGGAACPKAGGAGSAAPGMAFAEKPNDPLIAIVLSAVIAAKHAYAGAAMDGDPRAYGNELLHLDTGAHLAGLLAGVAAAGNNARTILELGTQGVPTDAQIDAATHILGGIAANRAVIPAAVIANHAYADLTVGRLAGPLEGYASASGAIDLYEALNDLKIEFGRRLFDLRTSLLSGRSMSSNDDYEDLRIAYAIDETLEAAMAHFRTAPVWTGHAAEAEAWDAKLTQLRREVLKKYMRSHR